MTSPALASAVRDLRAWASASERGAGSGAPAVGAPDLTLFLLHHAGGSAAGYLPYVSLLPANWRLLALELPGRLMSRTEEACRSVQEAVAWLLPQVRAALGPAAGAGSAGAGSAAGPGADFAVFGHSLGAITGFELVRELLAEGRRPVWLGVSGSAGPDRGADRNGRRRDQWPRERLIRFLRELGGTPEEVWAHPELVDAMLGVLRPDLALVDTYRCAPGPPLDVPVTVFAGQDDREAGPDMVRSWATYAGAGITFRRLPGGHFFPFEQVESVARQLGHDVAKACHDRPPALRAAPGGDLGREPRNNQYREVRGEHPWPPC